MYLHGLNDTAPDFWRIDFSKMDPATEATIRATDFSSAVEAGVNLEQLFAALVSMGATPNQLRNFAVLISRGISDPSGQFGKYAHNDTVVFNLQKFIATGSQNAADYRADAGSGGWFIHNLDTIFKVINPLAPLTGRVDAAIVRAIPVGGSFFKNLTAEALNPMTFLPGALPDPVGSAIGTAYFNRRVQGVDPQSAFVGANIDAVTGASIAAGGYALATGGFSSLPATLTSQGVKEAAVKGGITLATGAIGTALKPKPGPIPPVSSTQPGNGLQIATGSMGKAALIALPLLAVVGLMLAVPKRKASSQQRN